MSDISVNMTGGTVGRSQAQAGKGKDTGTYTPGPGSGTPPAKISPHLVREKWVQGSRITRPEQRKYWINRAFLAGEQWVYWDKQRDRISEMPRKDQRVRATVNKMRAGVRKLSSKLNRRPLSFEVTPKAADDASVVASAKAEAVLEHANREHDFEMVRRKWWDASFQGGTGVLCIDWDPRAGTKLSVDPESGKEYGTGDIQLTVLTVAEVVCEPGCRNIETARWAIKVLTLPPEQARDIYRLKETPQADASLALGPFQTRVLNTDGREVPIPMTMVLVYYERPNSLCPKGQVATVIGDELVEWSAWPFPWQTKMPMVALTETEINDRWQGDTILTDCVPVQTGLNASWSSILEHLKQAGNARLMVPEESLDIIDEFSDDAGEIIPFNGVGGAPSYLSPPNMPAWWMQMPTQLSSEIAEILGLNEVAQGLTPPSIDSGLGLAILNEADDTPMGEAAKKIASAWSKAASMILRLYADKAKESRTAKISGPGQSPMLVKWSGKDLLGNTDAIVPPEAIVPTSKAAQQAFAQSLWDRKIITSATVYAKIAELPYRKDLLQGIDDDLARAQRENHLMATGEICLPETFDDHAKHIQEHNAFRKSERYEHMREGQRRLVDMHVQAHATLAAESAGSQLSKQMVHPALASAPNTDQQGMVPDGDPNGLMAASPQPNPAAPAIPFGAPTGEPDAGSSAPGQGAAPGGPPTPGMGP